MANEPKSLIEELLEVPCDKPVKLHLKNGALKFYQWKTLGRDEDPLIHPEVLTAIVSSIDDNPDELTPSTRPHCPHITVDKEDYFMKISSPRIMVGYLHHSSRGFTLEPHPDFHNIRSNAPVIYLNAIESFEVI